MPLYAHIRGFPLLPYPPFLSFRNLKSVFSIKHSHISRCIFRDSEFRGIAGRPTLRKFVTSGDILKIVSKPTTIFEFQSGWVATSLSSNLSGSASNFAFSYSDNCFSCHQLQSLHSYPAYLFYIVIQHFSMHLSPGSCQAAVFQPPILHLSSQCIVDQLFNPSYSCS